MIASTQPTQAGSGRRAKESKDIIVDLTKKPAKSIKRKWVHKHWQFMKQNNLSPESVLGAYKRYHGTCPEASLRVKHLMDIVALKAQKADRTIRVINVSQSVDRCVTMSQHFPCITPAGSFYIPSKERFLHPCEKLLLQGLPLNKMDIGANSLKEVESLAGNSMHTRVQPLAQTAC
jgi:hypothetical protein